MQTLAVQFSVSGKNAFDEVVQDFRQTVSWEAEATFLAV